MKKISRIPGMLLISAVLVASPALAAHHVQKVAQRTLEGNPTGYYYLTILCENGDVHRPTRTCADDDCIVKAVMAACSIAAPTDKGRGRGVVVVDKDWQTEATYPLPEEPEAMSLEVPGTKTDCTCERGWYNPIRQSCAVTACEDVDGMPDGDKGGGYFALNETLFVDVEGADCGDDELSVVATVKGPISCDRGGGTTAEIELAISGGRAPYRCAGSATGFPQAIDKGSCSGSVPPGEHTFTVTDDAGTTASVTLVVSAAEDCPDIDNPADGAVGQIWNLGQLQRGKTYPSSVTAQNFCKGKRSFKVSVEGAPWLRIVGPEVIKKIPVGTSRSTEVVVDLTAVEPGEYRGRIHIDCLDCPPDCTQDRSQLDVVVAVR